MSGHLGGLLPIYQVICTPFSNGTIGYQVIYNAAESCQLQYSPSIPNPYLILSYSAMGIAISTTSNAYAQTGGNDVTRNSIMQFLTA